MPTISSWIEFFRPHETRLASNAAGAPEASRPWKIAASSTVTSRSTPSASVRRVVKVSRIPLTPTSCCPVMNWTASMMWAPMSPSAPDPALAASIRQVQPDVGSASQSWR